MFGSDPTGTTIMKEIAGYFGVNGSYYESALDASQLIGKLDTILNGFK